VKRNLVAQISALMLAIFLLVGCSSGATPATTVPTAAPTFAESATANVTPPAGATEAVPAVNPTTAVMDDAQMQALILEKLQGHHSIDIVLNARHTREEWNTTLDRMIARGAPISDAEKQLIIDWLLARSN
jgi:PBP1b-binding outer membrane lipoprotein LpoB